ncbi:hypothetical protein K1719_023942 [Acacia pycnantha]|nr:hypothetical protein K1719_023942 [Acacia pycnantha]
MKRKGRRNSSWLCTSILTGRDVIQGNIISSIGDGTSTRMWHDPWLQELSGKKLVSPCPFLSFSSMCVADLRNGEGWDVSIISSFLNESEVNVVISTRCALSGRPDKWLWTWGKKSYYLVKEGYRVAKNIAE